MHFLLTFGIIPPGMQPKRCTVNEERKKFSDETNFTAPAGADAASVRLQEARE